MKKTLFTTGALLLSTVASAADWKLQRMPWGDPDMQGIWTSATITTLERPDELEQLVITETQATALEKYGEDILKDIGF